METLKVEGMSCQHCVGSVKKAIESVGAENVNVDLDKKEAKFELKGSVTKEDVRAAIVEAGYKA